MKANAQFWQQMLQMRLETMSYSESFCVGEGHLRASISLSGMWAGRIEVRMAKGLAQAATAAMMMLPVDAVTEADVLDAIREIANMIGGVIKSSLPRPCVMTLPESGVADEKLCVSTATEKLLTVAFRHETGALILRVCEEACAGQ